MARKSPLTDKQWAEIEKRLLAGEKCRVLSREFGVAESTIRTRLSAQTAQIKAVAHQMVAAEEAFKSLPISAQISAQSLIDDLRAISTHLAGAAKFGAMTAHRLNGIAHQHAQDLDDVEPSMEKLGTVAKLSAVANEAAKTGLNLLSANKDQITKMNEGSGTTAGIHYVAEMPPRG
jgi:hypothetical protein